MRTHRCFPITTLTRTGQCLTAAALTAGLAFAAAPIAGAERSWDIEVYDKCIKDGGTWLDCCIFSGGDVSTTGQGCVTPLPLEQSFPPPPPPRQVTPVAPGSNAPILPVSPGGQAPTAPVG
jgi:hypothetical protein